jgi:carboxypeptidase D
MFQLTRAADALLRTSALPKLRLQGVAIGNGWIDPIHQYPGYVQFAYEKGLIKKGSPVGQEELDDRSF